MHLKVKELELYLHIQNRSHRKEKNQSLLIPINKLNSKNKRKKYAE